MDRTGATKLCLAEELFYRDMALSGPDPGWQHLVFPIVVDDALTPERVRECVNAMLDAHAVTRLRLTQVGRPGDVPEKYVGAAPLADALVVIESEQEEIARRLLATLADAPFDLARAGEPCIRVALARVNEARSFLVFVFHHLFVDFRAASLFVREFFARYADRSDDGYERALTVLDYGADERERLQDGRFETAAAYWRSELAGATSLLSPSSGGGEEAMVGPTVDVWEGGPEWAEAWAKRCAATEITPAVLTCGAVAAGVRAVTGESDMLMQLVYDPRRGRFRYTLGNLADRIFVRGFDAATAMTDLSLRSMQRKLHQGMAMQVPALYLYEQLPEVFGRWQTARLPGSDVMVNVVNVAQEQQLYAGAAQALGAGVARLSLEHRAVLPEDHPGLALMVFVLLRPGASVRATFLWGSSALALRTREALARAVVGQLAEAVGVGGSVWDVGLVAR